MLTTLTVNSLADAKLAGDGLVTLREAILAANANTTTDLGQTGSGTDTIVFEPGLVGTINLAAGEMAVTEALTINGPGRDLLTIDAQQLSRIFNITAAGDYRIAGLTLTKGQSAASGGAIVAQDSGSSADLTVEACTISHSAANWGGGLSVSHLTMINSIVSGNSASVRGGGIHSGYLSISNSTITGNTSSDSGGGISALYATIEGSVITANATGGSGGGIRAADRIGFGNLTLNNSVVSGNRAFLGGGICSYSAGNIVDSTIEGNYASHVGGGIYATRDLTVSRSTLSGNRAKDFGGGMSSARGSVSILESTIQGNVAGNGGGIWADSDTTLIGSAVVGNTSLGSGGGLGAGLGSFTVNKSVVSGNRAATSGGGIDVRDLIVNDSLVSGNVAETDGGGIRARGAVQLTNSTISGNRAMSGGGIAGGGIALLHVTITKNQAVGTGGGIFGGNVSATIANSIIAQNTAGTNAPDLNSNPAIVSSLIGDNAGSALSESQIPDAYGNLIGSSAGAGIFDPLLAPLANNGGPTATHALLPGSPALDAIPLFVPPDPTHDYHLNNSKTDALGGPSLVSLGGSLQATGYKFGKNQGLNLSSASINPAEYSLEIVFSWDAIAGGYQKIIDFHNLGSDVGLYALGSGLNFVNGAFAADVFAAGMSRQLVITRNDASDIVTAYVDGEIVWSFVDAAGDAVFNGPDHIIRFFQDDATSGQTEAQSGFVDRIRVFSQVLDVDEVQALVHPAVLPAFDQRGEPFARAVNYDGLGGEGVDMGAYESQGIPSYSPYDYNKNGAVDAADYNVWRDTLGQTGVAPNGGADGDGNGEITQADFDVWKSHFGEGPVITPPESAGAGSIAKPSTETGFIELAGVSSTSPNGGEAVAKSRTLSSSGAVASPAERDLLLLLTSSRSWTESRDDLFKMSPGTENQGSLDELFAMLADGWSLGSLYEP